MKSTFLLAFAVCVQADVYLHNPRGSNNRLDDQNRDRNNANRLFDSQNNNRGGANVGQVYYFTGSEIPMEWSQQHSCGNPNNNCDIVIQYTCDNKIRDGTTTKTIPINPQECYDFDCDSDVRFGRHESLEWYTSCTYRERNKGLFTSSQQLKGHTAKYTRQNPNGARRGYECPEERDYYPYWYPSPWKDIAVLTNQPERCAAYQQESENVKGRYFCDVPIMLAMKWYNDKKNKKKSWIPIDEGKCKNYTVYDSATNLTYTGKWEQSRAFGIAAPDCISNIWSRDNHHGNVQGGQWTGYNWTVPSDFVSEQCVMRLRYNISTGDMNHFTDKRSVADRLLTANITAYKSKTGEKQLVSSYPIASRYFPNKTYANLTGSKTNGRDYTLRNNPQVDMWGYAATTGKTPVRLQLAVNTAQFGRTFQDRTHRFAIRPAPAATAGKVIHNVQVRGKRGNIVQTYPGTEYDYVPNRLECRDGDYVHFQWTGSNTNPNNNAGQGRQGSDRHNIVLLRTKRYDEPTATDQTTPGTVGHWGNSYPAKLDDINFLGLDRSDMQNLAIMDKTGQFGGEMSELDDAGTYFDAGPKQCKNNGIYHYLCTRNNNFSNRSQKGKIRVTAARIISKRFDMNGGTLKSAAGVVQMVVEPGALTDSKAVEIAYEPATETTAEKVTFSNAGFTEDTVQWKFQYESAAFAKPVVYYRSSSSGEWDSIDSDLEDGVVTASITKTGQYKMERETDGGEVAGLVFGLLLVGGLGVFGFIQYRKRTGKGAILK